MNYQPPKALQAQSKNRAIKPAIQNTFEFDSNTSCEKVSDEISFSKSSDFWDKPVSSVFIKRKICFSDEFEYR
jgi:hypothetical protein